MPKYAIIDGSNTVSNVIVADTAEDALETTKIIPNQTFSVIEISEEPDSPGIGWLWDGEKLIAPPVVITSDIL